MPAFSQTLNLDSIDTVDTRRQRTPIQSAPVSAARDASPMFPAAPIYARKPVKKASNNMALLVGAPVVLVAAGAIAWAMMANPAQTPTETQQPAQMAIADPVPLSPPLAPAAMPTPEPVQTAAVEPAARAAPAPVRAAPRAAVARRAAPAAATTPDASSASSNVSATVAAPAPVVAAEPAPVVIAAPVAAAPAPTPTPVTPVDPQ